MSRISELDFYNDKDVITQIEWLKDHIGADHIKNITIEENTDPTSPDFGKTKITMFMENGEYYEGTFTSALIKSVDSRQDGEYIVLDFHLATGETITARCKITFHATASWDSLTGVPQDSEPLTVWMNTKTNNTDFANEVSLRAQGDTKNASDIHNLETSVNERIERIDTDLATKENITNKVTQWSETPSDTKYPSEKLVKNSIPAPLDVALRDAPDQEDEYFRISNIHCIRYGKMCFLTFRAFVKQTGIRSHTNVHIENYIPKPATLMSNYTGVISSCGDNTGVAAHGSANILLDSDGMIDIYANASQTYEYFNALIVYPTREV